MREKRSFYLLLIIMSVVALVTMLVTNVILYQIAFQEKSQSLVQTAQSQARLIEAMARYNRRTNRVDWELPVGERGPTSLLSERAAADTISQLKDAHNHYAGFGQTGEFVIAGIEAENIVFLLRHRHEVDSEPESIPLYSEESEPMRRALFAQSGVMVGKDYRGVEVLAAYEPVDVLNFGIVAKLDMAEIREPFIRATIYTSLVSFIVILFASVLFRRITNPIVETIRNSEKQYRSLVEEINEWVWSVDENGVITYSSPQIETFIGYDYQELVGRKLVDLFDVEVQLQATAFLTDTTIAKSAIIDYEVLVHGDGGRQIPMSFSATPIFDNDTFIGYRGVAHDITERKQAEQLRQEYQQTLERQVKERTEELHDINEELKNFTYIVSHDLRSPLVSIVGFSSEIKQDIQILQSPEKLAALPVGAQEVVLKVIPESLQFIDAATEKMDGLINNILALSRIGQRQLHIETVDSAAIVDKNLKALAYQLESIDVLVSPLPVIQTDELALEQIFGNLIGNAVKYIEPERKATIEIWAEQQPDYWLFHVKDNGKGIAANDIPHIFDLFKRVGDQHVPGDGMGLTYVQTLIRRLGGRIQCDSVLGTGSTFSFSLPNTAA